MGPLKGEEPGTSLMEAVPEAPTVTRKSQSDVVVEVVGHTGEAGTMDTPPAKRVNPITLAMFFILELSRESVLN
jgi:hypothetical protein